MLDLVAGIQAAQRLTRESLELEPARRSRAPLPRARPAILRVLSRTASSAVGALARTRRQEVARPCSETRVD